MRIDLFTLFPAMFTGPFDESIVKRAVSNGLVTISIHNIRDWTHDRHHTTDDRPYGGGAGMVLMAPPVVESVESVLGGDLPMTRILVTSAGGRMLDQTFAAELAQERSIAIVCGHYEGIDERAIELLNAEVISIGDYVLTGGELPAMVIVDAMVRLIPGVINEASVVDESHRNGSIEYPHYTRPPDYRGLAVPNVLISGHHANVEKWRAEQSKMRTERRAGSQASLRSRAEAQSLESPAERGGS